MYGLLATAFKLTQNKKNKKKNKSIKSECLYGADTFIYTEINILKTKKKEKDF